MNEEIDIILARYFSGEATKEELHALDIWLSSSDENELYFHQMSQLYQHAGETDTSHTFDTEQALQQFKTYIYKKQDNSRNLFYKAAAIWKIAAVVALLLMATFTLFYFIQPSKTVQLTAVETQKEYQIFENAEVTLFPGAEIVYHKKNSHQIQLIGKATFNIQTEENKKLIVRAGETFIEDIGTVFTVDATASDKFISVEVSEGEVWFYTEKNSGVYLKAGESAVYDTQTEQFKTVEKQPVLIEETLAEEFLAKELIFYNTPLYEAVELIKACYNVEIVINSNTLSEILLNASFAESESVEYVLEIISATLSANLSKKNGKYVIAL